MQRIALAMKIAPIQHIYRDTTQTDVFFCCGGRVARVRRGIDRNQVIMVIGFG